jgi:2-dehydropantoate 2-reductase
VHYVVIGAGNIGCLYGGNLARVGEEVTLLDLWSEHVERIQRSGLQLDGLRGSFTARVAATTDPGEVAPADAALICVNAYSTAEAARSAARFLKPEGFVVTLQNGVGNVEALSAILGAGRVLAGLVFHSAELRGLGWVTHTNEGPTYLGELDRTRSPRLLALAAALDRAELSPAIEPDIMATIWGKFVHNCGINALCAITDLRPSQLHEVPDVDAFQTDLIEEALALVAAKGITLADPDPLGTIKAYCAGKSHRVSMVQHLDQGKRVEIDALNGYVARESALLGLAAPASLALTRLVRGLEHSRRQRGGRVVPTVV